MTDREMTEEWADKNINVALSIYIPQVKSIAKRAFLAGLKAGRLEWHDLRENPDDLPNDYRSVWTNKGGACHYDDGWFDGYGHVEGVIAWCEPKFEENKQ